MILGYHLIMTAYGFWLPNDPRGSWSDFVGKWELFVAGGKATKVDTRASVAHHAHDREARLTAKEALRYPPVKWDGRQALTMTEGFAEVAEHWGLNIHACSMMPKHVHLVIGRTGRDIEGVMNQLKGRASSALATANLHPFQHVAGRRGKRQTCWTQGGWNVFLDSQPDMHRAIGYVENNPVKDGNRPQRWSFVKAYHG